MFMVSDHLPPYIIPYLSLVIARTTHLFVSYFSASLFHLHSSLFIFPCDPGAPISRVPGVLEHPDYIFLS